LTVTPEALTQESEQGTGRILWAEVDRIEATKDHAFIYSSGNTSLIVPRRAFADKDEFAHFVSTAKRFHEGAIHAGE
jgi:hypothetical protein